MVTAFLLVVAGASVAASLTDWVFMDLLIRRFYAVEPSIWRPTTSETGRILWSQIIGIAASAAIAWLCLATQAATVARGLEVATAGWLAGAAPVTVQNVLWMKLHPAIGASHAAGWLVRCVVTALLAVWLLPHALP